MAGFGPAPLLLKVSLFLVLAGFLFHLIGFATPYWQNIKYMRSHYGLWRGCSGRMCGDMRNNASWFEATQAFETLGFIASAVAALFVILYIFVNQVSGRKLFHILTMLLCFATAGLIILGVIIFGLNVNSDFLSWSFALSVIGGILYAVAGLLLLVNLIAK